MSMEVKMIVLEDAEVFFEYDMATGKLKIKVPIKTVLEKLPAKVTYLSGYCSKEEVESEYFPKLSGVDFHMWLSMNFEQTKTKKRSLNVYAKVLGDLLKLAEKYDCNQLNEAISKCNTPEKCTIAYLCAILRNNGKKGGEDGTRDGKYERSISEAVSRFM